MKKMEDRLKLGISNRDFTKGMSKITGLNYLGDYSHDNIDVRHIMKGTSPADSTELYHYYMYILYFE